MLGVVVVILRRRGSRRRSSRAASVLLPDAAARRWGRSASCGPTGTLADDLWASAERILIGYAISVAIGVVVGIAIGTFASVEAFFEPPDRVPPLHPGHAP